MSNPTHQESSVIFGSRDPLLTVAQFKEQVPVSDATIWRWEQKGYIKFVRIGVKKFISQSQVTELKRDGRAV